MSTPTAPPASRRVGRRGWAIIVIVGVVVIALLALGAVEFGYPLMHPLVPGAAGSEPESCDAAGTCTPVAEITPGTAFRFIESVKNRGFLPVTLTGVKGTAHRSPLVIDGVSQPGTSTAQLSADTTAPISAVAISPGETVSFVVAAHADQCKPKQAGKPKLIKKIALTYHTLVISHTTTVKLVTPVTISCQPPA